MIPHQTLRIIGTVILSFIPFVVWKLFIDLDYIEPYLTDQKIHPVHYVLEIGHYWSMILLLNLSAYLCRGRLNKFLKWSFYLAVIHLLMYLGWRYRIPNTLHLTVYFIYGTILYIRLRQWKL